MVRLQWGSSRILGAPRCFVIANILDTNAFWLYGFYDSHVDTVVILRISSFHDWTRDAARHTICSCAIACRRHLFVWILFCRIHDRLPCKPLVWFAIASAAGGISIANINDALFSMAVVSTPFNGRALCTLPLSNVGKRKISIPSRPNSAGPRAEFPVAHD